MEEKTLTKFCPAEVSFKNECATVSTCHDRVTGNRFTLQTQATRKLEKIYEHYFSDIGQQKKIGTPPARITRERES